jgi:hypothetical protein
MTSPIFLRFLTRSTFPRLSRSLSERGEHRIAHESVHPESSLHSSPLFISTVIVIRSGGKCEWNYFSEYLGSEKDERKQHATTPTSSH